MAEKQNKEDRRMREELSDKTLELMLFKEMLTNSDFLSRLSNVVDFRWFRTPHVRIMAEFALAFFKRYGGLVTRDIMESFIQKRNENQAIEANKLDLNQSLFDFNKAKDLDLGTMDNATKIAKIQTYIKQEAMRNALLDAATNLETVNTDGLVEDTLKKFEDIQKILFEEVDLGVELSSSEVEDTLEKHMEFLTNPGARISTGWQSLDDITHGGFYKDGKSLFVFMAQAGLGKSNVLANLGYNFLKQNLKVAVISMEMSQNVYLRRFDSLITKIDIDDLGLSSMTSILKERMTNFFTTDHPEARLNVKEFSPNSQSARTLETYVEKLVENSGWKPDVLIVDYLNLLKPNGGSRRSESSMYEDGKVVSEELRKLSYDLEIPIITAVQCNSSGFNTADIGMENIAESRGIAHTADFIAGLYRTEDEQLDGIFHMKILKSRLGDYGNLKFQFDKRTMEFTDINDVGSASTTSKLVNLTQPSGSGKVNVDDVDRLMNGVFEDDLGCP